MCFRSQIKIDQVLKRLANTCTKDMVCYVALLLLLVMPTGTSAISNSNQTGSTLMWGHAVAMFLVYVLNNPQLCDS